MPNNRWPTPKKLNSICVDFRQRLFYWPFACTLWFPIFWLLGSCVCVWRRVFVEVCMCVCCIFSLWFFLDKRDKYGPLTPAQTAWRRHPFWSRTGVWGMVTSDYKQAWLAASVSRLDRSSQPQLGGQSAEMPEDLWPWLLFPALQIRSRESSSA